ncbi:MAG: hypothetical protein U0821_17530 [Chloroflexota bacterium]
MNYGALISKSFRMTLRYRYLWLLTLLAGGSGASGGGSGGGPGSSGGRGGTGSPFDGGTGELGRVAASAWQWVQDHMVWIMLGVLVLLALVLVLVILAIICRGAASWATSQLALGHPCTLGMAWRNGQRLGFRYFRLGLLSFAIGGGIALVLGGIVAAIVVSYLSTGKSPGLEMIPLVVAGVILLLCLIPFFIALRVAFLYADRALANEEIGAVAALKHGVRTLWDRLGTTVLVWLIDVGMSIAIGFGLLLVVALCMIPLAGVGVAIYFLGGQQFSAGLIAYIAVASVIFLLVMLVVNGAVGTFHWSYWTHAYLNLTGRLDSRMEPAE